MRVSPTQRHKVSLRCAFSAPDDRLHSVERLYLVRGPDRADETKGVELVASVSSPCLEEAPPLAGPSATTSTVILGSWSTMRKSSASFVVGDDVANATFDF